MADALLLNDGTSRLLLEDGSSLILLESPTLLYFSDDFNRADGALGTNWAHIGANNVQIASNQVVGGTSSDPGFRWTTATTTDDQFSQAQVYPGTSNSQGPALAMPNFADQVSGANAGTFYRLAQNSGTQFLLQQKNLGLASFTTLQTYSGLTITSGDTFRIEYVNHVLYTYQNGTLLGTFTPPNPIVGQRYVGLSMNSSGASGIVVFDNWTGGDYGASSTTNISGSESSAITISDASASAISSTSTDATAITIAEGTSAVQNAFSGTESPSISIADTSSIVVTQSVVDSTAITITEGASAISVVQSATDTTAITIVDNSSSLSTLSRTDTAAITISEGTSAVASSTTTTDTAAITITDISAITDQRPGSETPSIDTAAIAITDISAVTVQRPGSETTSISITDTSSVFITVSVTDTSGNHDCRRNIGGSRHVSQ
jgi:hypothetical protein